MGHLVLGWQPYLQVGCSFHSNKFPTNIFWLTQDFYISQFTNNRPIQLTINIDSGQLSYNFIKCVSARLIPHDAPEYLHARNAEINSASGPTKSLIRGANSYHLKNVKENVEIHTRI